jgi:DNA-binding NarL/FixJ family response regulator
MQTFQFARSNRSSKKFELNEQEEQVVNAELPKFATKQAAVTYLLKRGWSTSAICRKIRYEDDRELRPQHVNQIRQKLNANAKS